MKKADACEIAVCPAEIGKFITVYARGPRVSAAADNFIAFSNRPTYMRTMDGLRYAAGQNRYVYAMSAAWRSSRGTLSALQQLPTVRRNFSGAVRPFAREIIC